MKREDTAWDNLTDIQKAQLIHFYPELAEDKHRARQDAGRLGGISTLMKYGNDHYSKLGKQGGRPRAKRLEECIEVRDEN